MREEGKFVAGQRFQNRSKVQRRPAYNHAQNSEQQFNYRWLLKVSFAILIVSALIWVGQKISDPQTFPIQSVEIKGNYTHVDKDALRQLVTPFTTKGLLWIDASNLQDRLKQLPWVYTADVKRVWPNHLLVTLKEQKPIARMNNDALVNEEGDVFVVDQKTIPANLPLFISPVAGQQKLMLDNFKTMNNILAPLTLKIVDLSLDARQSWVLQLDNGLIILLGKIDPAQRLQRFVQIYSQIVGNNAAEINTIDLRYANGVAVHFKNQTVISKI